MKQSVLAQQVLVLSAIVVSTKIGWKREKANKTLACLQSHSQSVSIARLQIYPDFKKMIESVQGQLAVLILNQHALNITKNWLCNVRNFEDVMNSLLVLAVDELAYEDLKRNWPQVRVFLLDIPEMGHPFKAGDCHYQMFQLFRANLAALLSSMQKKFWVLQPDTYWRESLLSRKDLERSNADILVDVEGESTLSSKMVAGGHLFVSPTISSAQFFYQLNSQLKKIFATDNNLLSSMCARQVAGAKCSFIPYWVISNWRMKKQTLKYLPLLIQFDDLITPGSIGKLERMHLAGAKFTTPSGACLTEDVSLAVSVDSLAASAVEPPALFLLAHQVCETLSQRIPLIVDLLLHLVFPNFAYFLV